MIKQTFYNLSEEKRQRITDAIVAEFSNAEDEKISINRIIKHAQISRGSFYQYFDDKVDLIEVLLATAVSLVMEGVEQALAESKGDIFYTYERMYDIIVQFAEYPTKHEVLKRLVKNLHANDNLVSEYMTLRFNRQCNFAEFSKRFSRENLRYRDDADVEYLAQIIISVLKNALFNFFVLGRDAQEVKNDFSRKLQIIKKGAVL